jgi:hypothetical protein
MDLGRWKEYDVVEANNSYASLWLSHVTLVRERRVTLPWMTRYLDSLSSQGQSLYPYGHEENDI